MIKHVLDATDPTRMKYQHIATLHRRIDDIQRRHQRYVDLLVAHQRQELSFLHQVAASNNLKNGVISPVAEIQIELRVMLPGRFCLISFTTAERMASTMFAI